jgi:hypothetical protein
MVVADPKSANPARITAAFKFPVLILTVPGFSAENKKFLVLLTSCTILGPATAVFRIIVRPNS